jgi:hypothetical protein
MNHQPLFSNKYFAKRLQHFSLNSINNLEQRQQHITNWQKMIAQGIVADTKEIALQAENNG